MRKGDARLVGMLEPAVEGLGYELLGIDYMPAPRQGLLRLYIDHPNGITVDDCARVSHQVSGVLDVEDPIPGEYNLEVSSPGTDRPLFTLEHFERFLGEVAKVTLDRPLEGRRNFKGILRAIEGNEVVMTVDNRDVNLPFEMMEKARLKPE